MMHANTTLVDRVDLATPLSLSSQPTTGPSALALAQRAGAQRLRAMCWFLDAGNNERPARSTGRRPKSAKARSRGKLAAAEQRVLCRFDIGADLDDGQDASTRPPARVVAREVGRVR